MSAAVRPSLTLDLSPLALCEASAGWRMTVVVCPSPFPLSVTTALTPAAPPPPSSPARISGRTMDRELGAGVWLIRGSQVREHRSSGAEVDLNVAKAHRGAGPTGRQAAQMASSGEPPTWPVRSGR